jgi:hypothetical protein
MPGPDPAGEEADKAAAEAARIGGSVSSDPPREAEGFEQAEDELIEHASHGDQHAARQAIEDAPEQADDARAADGSEADHERSSEREDDR